MGENVSQNMSKSISDNTQISEPENLVPTTKSILTQDDEWHKVSPIAILYFIEKLVVGIINNVFYMIPMFITLWDEIRENPWIAVGIVGVILGLVTFFAVWSFLVFRYRLSPTTVEVKSGIFKKKHVDLPFNRIQNIKIEQPFYYRLFGFATMAFDSGGSLQQEARLIGLPLSFAQSLQMQINDVKAQVSVGKAVLDKTEENNNSHIHHNETIVNTRSLSDLVFHGITSNRIFIILAGLAPFVDNIFGYIGEKLASWGVDIGQTIESESFIILAIYALSLFLLCIGLITLLSIVGAIIMFYGYTLSKTTEKFIRRSGLITKHEISVTFSRIQVAIMKQDWLDIVFGRYNLKLEQLNGQIANANPSAVNNKLMVPSVFAYECRDILAHVFPLHNLHEIEFLNISKRFIIRHLIILAIPMSVLTGFLAWNHHQGNTVNWLYPIVLTSLWSGLIVLRWWRWGYAVNETYIYIRKGLFGADRYCIPINKVQRVTFSQSVFMEKAQLASLKIQLASGSYSIPLINADLAQSIQTYILYNVESKAQAWM